MYETGRPINGAVVSPVADEVITGGGQDAQKVTTSNVDSVQFESHIFGLSSCEVEGHVSGHFGPINSVAIAPDGRSFATAGEDGYVRLNQFAPSYFDSK